MVLTSVEPKTSDPIVTDSDRSFLALFEFFGITAFSTEDSDDIRDGCVPRLRGDKRVGVFVVFCFFVGEGSSTKGSAHFPLLARGVGAGVGGEMLLRCVVGVEGGGGGGGWSWRKVGGKLIGAGESLRVVDGLGFW